MQGTEGSAHSKFVEATKIQRSLLATVERRCLIWMAERLPTWVSPDHMTLIGLLGSIGMGVSYSLAQIDRHWLFAVSVFNAVSWFGDCLNGTLARVRQQVRPRYGFYIDHLVDSVGAVFLMVGLGISGLMSPGIAAVLLITLLMLSVEAYLATYAVGIFQISHWRVGPTEIRIVLVVFNLVAYWFPTVKIHTYSFLLFDLLGEFGIAFGVAMLVTSIRRNLRALHRIDPP